MRKHNIAHILNYIYDQADDLAPIKRITGEDSFIPLGTSWQYVFPSKQSIIDTVCSMVLPNKKVQQS